jgi:hypothetical protein
MVGLPEKGQEQVNKWFWTYKNEQSNMAILSITPAIKLKMAS